MCLIQFAMYIYFFLHFFRLSGKHNQAHILFFFFFPINSLSRPADLGHRSCHFELTVSELCQWETALGTKMFFLFCFFFVFFSKRQRTQPTVGVKACCTVPNKYGHICNKGCRWDLTSPSWLPEGPSSSSLDSPLNDSPAGFSQSVCGFNSCSFLHRSVL